MNPSTGGWINKLFRALFNNEHYAVISNTEMYAGLRSIGFIYGFSMQVVNDYVNSEDFTIEERSKVNLIIALNCVYKNSTEKRPFVKSVIAFYKAINQHKTSLFDDLFGERINSQTLERIIHRRVQIDPNFLRFVHADVPVDPDSRVEEIVWGGVRVDGIPALDNPTMVDPEDAVYLLAEERGFGVSINGDTRFYPARFLDWHEMFNDIVGGEPVSLAY